MLAFKSLFAFLAFAMLPNHVAAEGSGYPGYPRATQVAIETAKSCDDDAALTYSKLNNENAEMVARASFEKCYELWSKADKIYVVEKDDLYGQITQAEKKANPYIATAHINDIMYNRLENWKRDEIERLLVIVMDARLKYAPAR